MQLCVDALACQRMREEQIYGKRIEKLYTVD